jgi:SAM-dependent methyltransferase
MTDTDSRLHVAALQRPWAERLVADVLRPRQGETCLDMPCGDGALTAALARAAGPAGRVIALDTDPDAVTSCQAAVTTLGLVAVDVGLLDPRARPPRDVADVAGSLFTLAHRPAAADLLAAAAEALRPGGRLGAAVWSAPGTVPPIDHLIAALAAVGGGAPPALVAALSLGLPAALEAVAAQAGLEGAQVVRLRDIARFNGVDHMVATLSSAYGLDGELDSLDEAGFAAVMETLGQRLLPFTAWDGTLLVPVEALVLEARA